jgi:hypothetical protein
MPRPGAANSDTATTPLNKSTMVGRWQPGCASELATAPAAPHRPADRRGEGDHRPQPPAPLAGRRRRRDDHRAHQHDAHGLQPDHDRCHEQRGQQAVEAGHRQPEARAEAPVERQQLEFLPEQRQRPQRDDPDDHHGHHVLEQECRRLSEQEGLEAGLGGVRQLLDVAQQHQAEAEEHRERHAQRAVEGHRLQAVICDRTSPASPRARAAP